MLTQARLKELLHYDPESGVFTWLVNRPGPRSAVAGFIGRGRCRISVCGTKYLSHRLAFLYMTGAWPEEEVDHINGVRHDNRWGNLRPASSYQNQHNTKLRATNSSGVKGVRKRGKSYQAAIISYGKRFIKSFSTIEEAEEWAEFVREELHGCFTNHGRAV